MTILPTIDESEKPYELKFEELPNYLFADVKADRNDVATTVMWFGEIIEKCREIGVNLLLVKLTVPEALTMPEMFDAAAGVVALGIRGIKIAFVDPVPEHFEKNSFAELVGTNRGANAKVFVNIDEAESWLLS